MTNSNPSPSDASPPKSGERAVVVRGLTKVFKDLWGRTKAQAVKGVGFEVHHGEVFGLLGPNGSGKSTTIKILLGLLHPTSGYAEVLGKSPRNVAVKERIGYLPEESYLYRYLTAAETLNFYGHIFALSPNDRKVRTEQLLEMVGLAAVGSRMVGEFSKGMLRRLGLAQALLNDPDLVILDEPTAGLDPIGCREVKDVILSLARRGKTVILSSHLLADVEDVCDRVVIYYGGKIQAAGPLRELLATPDSLRFTTPRLSRPLVEEVLQLIRRETGDARVRVDVPTQNLEGFFLEVVERARHSDQSTSGATAGNRVAAYLESNRAAESSAGKVLERLSANPPQPPSPQEAPTVRSQAPGMDDRRLAELTRAKPSNPGLPNEAATTGGAAEKSFLREADQKLSSLLTTPKDKP